MVKRGRSKPLCLVFIYEKSNIGDVKMAEITAKLVKELREKSGAGVMDAKKALVETDGDIDKAIELLRE